MHWMRSRRTSRLLRAERLQAMLGRIFYVNFSENSTKFDHKFESMIRNQTGQAHCTLCSRGSYQNQQRQSKCLPCGLGSHARHLGQHTCEECLEGFFANFLGHIYCEPCPPGNSKKNLYHMLSWQLYKQNFFLLNKLGTYQDQKGSNFCKQCSAGTFNLGFGRRSCATCEPGSYSWEGAYQCELCPPGTFQVFFFPPLRRFPTCFAS
jgi:hypothetical protein